MKILKMGKKKERPKKKVCPDCGTVFTYTSADTEYFQRDDVTLVFCPNKDCKKGIMV